MPGNASNPSPASLTAVTDRALKDVPYTDAAIDIRICLGREIDYGSDLEKEAEGVILHYVLDPDGYSETDAGILVLYARPSAYAEVDRKIARIHLEKIEIVKEVVGVDMEMATVPERPGES
jgi:hypothetical protein